MGFRFNLESANIIANLACGKVYACYDEICCSHQNFYGLLYFLDAFEENMFSDDIAHLSRRVKRIRHELEGIDPRHLYRQHDTNSREVVFSEDSAILELLLELSNIFHCCQVKALLLPPALDSKGNEYDFMMSEDTLRELVRWHPSDSCLILQPQERVHHNRVTIFDSFPNFDIALRQIDTWPAVLLWDNFGDFCFIPIEDKSELYHIFEILHFEPRSISTIKYFAELKKEKSHYYFHLSDLHFGTKNIETRERRLRTLIKAHLSSMEPDDKIGFIVTGDAVDSPTNVNNTDYLNFSDFLASRSDEEPIFVLGNHDVNRVGLALNNNNQSLANIVGRYPEIKIIKDIKVIFLLFNSNTNGHLAQGEIGENQMSEMGNKLDEIKNLSEYTLVAVLHHHVADIPTPSFYDERWYKKLLPKGALEQSLRLTDADIFLEWMKARNVKFVLHGHKHIPYFAEIDGIHIIACGSSTGYIRHKDKRKTYLSYNLLKFTQNEVVCSEFAEELLGTGAKDINTRVITYN